MPETKQSRAASVPAAGVALPRLTRAFFQRDAVTVAKALLGQRLVRLVDGVRLAGLIIETEAYLGAPDLAAHTAHGRRTQRNASMWLAGGHAYVYFTYGMHHCMNVVAGKAEEPVAVLLRAVEPIEGIKQMYACRAKAKRDVHLCSGPGKLCQAMQVSRDLDGTDLCTSDDLWIERERSRCIAQAKIVTTTRVGVDYAGPWAKKPLRFYLRDNLHVSKR